MSYLRILVVITGACALAQTPKQESNRWSYLGKTSVARTGACAVSLNDNRLMIAGGGPPGASRSVDLLDSSGVIRQGSSLLTGQAKHTCTVMLDGRILVTGGFDSIAPRDLSAIYDPDKDSWIQTNAMVEARMSHTATLLLDGRVLIAGGENSGGILSSLEIFDPATSRYSRLAPMANARKGHAASILDDGRVLIAGGANDTGSLSTMEVFDPSSGSTHRLGRMLSPRTGLTATKLGNGTVLLAGGMNGTEALASAEIFDPSRTSTSETVSMLNARNGHLAFVVPGTGEVLLAGGDGGIGTAEMFSPSYSQSSQKQVASAEAQLKIGGDGMIVRTAAGTGAADLDQCANGPAPAPGVIGTTCVSWVNGNLNSSKASYREGDSVAYRLKMSGIPTTGSNTVTIEWDTTQTGKHAIDYLTRFDASITGALPCAGISCGAQGSPFPIPVDPNITDNQAQPLSMLPGKLAGYIAQSAGQIFNIWGGQITGVSAYAVSGSYGSSSSTRITITFTASVSNPVLAWGGHIATRVDWGPAFSAVSISGSPFHTRLIEINGGGGNQDRALSSDAAVFPATISVTKSTNIPAADDAFTFTVSPGFPDGNPPSPVPTFTLPVRINGTQYYTRVFDKIFVTGTQAFTLSESSLPPGWTLQNVTCSKISATGSVSVNANIANFSVQEGDVFACTFTNAAPVTVTFNKACVPTDDGGSFTLNINGTTAPASCGGSTSKAVAIGSSVNVSESGTSLSNYTSTIACGNDTPIAGTSLTFTMPNANVSCTVTNTRRSFSVTLSKVCAPSNDTGKFSLSVNGSGNEVSCGGSVVRSVFVAEPVTLTETAGANTLLSSYDSVIACVDINLGGSGLQRTFTMPAANVSCTVTNTRKSYNVTFAKVCAPITDSGKFGLNINGSGGEVGCGESVTRSVFAAAEVTLTETAGTNTLLASYDSVIACTDINLGGSGLQRTFTMPAVNVSCIVTNTRKSFNVTLSKVCVPVTDPGKFGLSISGSGSEVGCGESVTRAAFAAAEVTLSETAGTNTLLSSYDSAIACTGVNLGGTGLQRTFTMPTSNVSCTVTNTRKAHNVTVSKVCLPVNDPGRFILNVNGSGNEVACGGSVVRPVVAASAVELTETAGANTLLANYVSEIACTGISLGGSGLTRTFTMPDEAVSCTITNRRPALTVTKSCAAGLNGSLAVTVSSSGQVCNTGGIDLTGFNLTDVQLIGAGTGVSGSVTFDNSLLAPGACRNYTSTFVPTQASSGACAPGDSSCTIAFSDKVTVTATGGGITVSDNKTASCSLCK